MPYLKALMPKDDCTCDFFPHVTDAAAWMLLRVVRACVSIRDPKGIAMDVEGGKQTGGRSSRPGERRWELLHRGTRAYRRPGPPAPD